MVLLTGGRGPDNGGGKRRKPRTPGPEDLPDTPADDGGGGGKKPKLPNSDDSNSDSKGKGNGEAGEGDDGIDAPIVMPDAWLDDLPRKESNSRETLDDVKEDTQHANPNYLQGRAYGVNCTRVAAAVEMRAQGYDVTAEPLPEEWVDKNQEEILEHVADGGSYPDNNNFEIPRNWKTANGQSRNWDHIDTHMRTPKEMREQVQEIVESWGDGGRGFISLEWNKGGGHIFNLENRDGKMYYIEGQVNYNAGPENDGQAFINRDGSFFRRVRNGWNTISVMRTDDMIPQERLIQKGWIRNRTTNTGN